MAAIMSLRVMPFWPWLNEASSPLIIRFSLDEGAQVLPSMRPGPVGRKAGIQKGASASNLDEGPMTLTRYTQFTGDLSSSFGLDDLTQALADSLRDAGLQAPDAPFQNMDESMESLRETIKQ